MRDRGQKILKGKGISDIIIEVVAIILKVISIIISTKRAMMILGGTNGCTTATSFHAISTSTTAPSTTATATTASLCPVRLPRMRPWSYTCNEWKVKVVSEGQLDVTCSTIAVQAPKTQVSIHVSLIINK